MWSLSFHLASGLITWRNLIKYLVDSDECVEWTEVRENGQEALVRVWLDG